ncbi:uncharacterized protein BHQ10_006496 [Talaromyces amestolkiae]|uniref:Uncharacterized protein n=1 Tax=Talaromyces amestolkiae TaxID=1196081 RepID=A0A364L3X0_TALAM|nr:uncharacterized protein BHQ10_006496 [Talaromyces amestolkiae]RAO70484.1 hypothetical protein BHQ10_006496 [Talaromyces amestolkiae]
MIPKRGHTEDDGFSSSKRSRASISPQRQHLGRSKGKSTLHSSSEGRYHVIEIENTNNDIIKDDEDDYTSSSGTSSSEDDNNGQENERYEISETIPYIPGRPKPQISLPAKSSDLLSRISSFLPQLQAANADIEQRLARGESLEDMILDDVKDDEAQAAEGEERTYIEMNLGLGVLKEKKKKRQPGDISLGDESSSGSDKEEDETSPKEGADEDGEGQVLNQLMGLKNRSGQKLKTNPGIQEVDDG